MCVLANLEYLSILFCAVLLLLLCALFQSGQQWLHTTMASRRIKIDRHFDDLEEVYFSSRRLTADTALASASTQVYLVSVLGLVLASALFVRMM